MSEKKDPLDELIVEEDKEVDKALLAELLRGKVEITASGKINLTEEVLNYPDWKKLLVYLLARKVVYAKKLIGGMKEGAMPADIGKAALMSNSTVAKRLGRELKSVVEKTSSGYVIPNYRLIKCRSLLMKGEAGKE
jgi:hypothetical protein